MATTQQQQQQPDTPKTPVTTTCRCGRDVQQALWFICPGCDKPVPICECTVAAHPLQPLTEEGRAPLGEQIAKLVIDLQDQAARIEQLITDAGTHLAGRFSSTGLELVLERAHGSTLFHAKQISAKLTELHSAAPTWAAELRDQAQKALQRGEQQESAACAAHAERILAHFSAGGGRRG